MALRHPEPLVQSPGRDERRQLHRSWMYRILEEARHQVECGGSPTLTKRIQDFVDAGKWPLADSADSIKALIIHSNSNRVVFFGDADEGGRPRGGGMLD